jgi:hypothetical protein
MFQPRSVLVPFTFQPRSVFSSSVIALLILLSRAVSPIGWNHNSGFPCVCRRQFAGADSPGIGGGVIMATCWSPYGGWGRLLWSPPMTVWSEGSIVPRGLWIASCSRACPRRQDDCQASALWEGLGWSWFVTTCLGRWDVRLAWVHVTGFSG